MRGLCPIAEVAPPFILLDGERAEKHERGAVTRPANAVENALLYGPTAAARSPGLSG
jgi:hypothetical protein